MGASTKKAAQKYKEAVQKQGSRAFWSADFSLCHLLRLANHLTTKKQARIG
ncbi:hypothetical protein BN8_02073 [Fibrisoma limi BUZ 3]|uniref:Uncharacterized protein n=1 Tax=Fibrisoma limi BUZ 3 TaxID=1185876 RepID=I2GGJ1_9BACT|nr:hypothetical protein BN8_02073 [Fibrisoma limi BUZ 3]